MKFSINLGAWNSVFAIPTQVVDQHLKLAGGVHLKVLLWLLRHAGNEIDITDISNTLGIGTADIKDAIQYWAAAGLITDFSCDCEQLRLHLLWPNRGPSESTTPETSVSTQTDNSEEAPHSEIIEHTVTVHPLTQMEDEKTTEKPIKTSVTHEKTRRSLHCTAHCAMCQSRLFNAGGTANFRTGYLSCFVFHFAYDS